FNFNGGTTTNMVGQGGYVARVDADGGLVWIRAVRGSYGLDVSTVLVAPPLTYVAGNFVEGIEREGFGRMFTGPLSHVDGYISRYDDANPNVVTRSVRIKGDQGMSRVTGIAFDTNGNVVASVEHTTDFSVDTRDINGSQCVQPAHDGG